MKHTVKFWDKKLLSLQRLADSVGYDIDSDVDYIAACACQPAIYNEFCKMKYPRPEILPLFYKVVERVQLEIVKENNHGKDLQTRERLF